MDFILNGQANGDVATKLLASNFDPKVLRPYQNDDNKGSYVSVMNSKGKLEQQFVSHIDATLRKDDWKLLDTVVVKVARERLNLVADLRTSGLTFNIPQGMAKTVLETETQSDISEASISMDALDDNQADRPVFELSNLPLPIIHKDFHFSARQIAASRNGNSPLDTSMAEAAAREVSDTAEKLAIGTTGSYQYGGGTIFGLTNFPQRLTKVMKNPLTGTGYTPADTVDDVLAMRQQSHDVFHFGPYRLYNSPAWDQFLDSDYVAAAPQNTLRERLLKISNIEAVTTLDFLSPGFQMVLVQQTSNVIREVIGMDVTTLQWETKGGLQLNFKVMAILVPQLRADHNGNTGIVHGTAA